MFPQLKILYGINVMDTSGEYVQIRKGNVVAYFEVLSQYSHDGAGETQEKLRWREILPHTKLFRPGTDPWPLDVKPTQ
jgi:hypothetical protein